MMNVVGTGIMIIEGIDMTIMAIGDLGGIGIDTQKNIRTYTNMEGITGRKGI
jgi:hypothetical protein